MSAERQTLLARYGRPAREIETESKTRIVRLIGPRLPSDPTLRAIAVHLLYAVGDPAMISELRLHPEAAKAGLEALRASRPLVVDVRMVAAGVDSRRLEQLGSRMVCAIDQPDVSTIAAERGITRSAAAFDLLAGDLDGAVVAIGNAPTALLALLDAVDDGRARPALIVGTPVGLVAAAEAKAELTRRAVPYLTVLGARGGSALAAAAINALLRLAVGSRAAQ